MTATSRPQRVLDARAVAEMRGQLMQNERGAKIQMSDMLARELLDNVDYYRAALDRLAAAVLRHPDSAAILADAVKDDGE